MRLFMLSALMFSLYAGFTTAQNTPLKRLDTLNEGRQWDAVGRLELAGSGFCTGALIAPDLVLTAAHCLFDKETGLRIDETEVEFQAGLRNGRASAYRQVRRVVVHPEFHFQPDSPPDHVKSDLALLELVRPIRNGTIQPFATGAKPAQGARVGIVSYAHDSATAPSLQDLCEVLAQQDRVLVTSCSVDFGASGAPIFVMQEGVARIVSVVSAKAEFSGQTVSLGTDLQRPLAELRAELDAGAGSFPRSSGQAKRVRVGDAAQSTGAKFVRP